MLFYDRQSQREASIVSAMPPPPVPRGLFHLDPHPHFSPDGRWAIYTTMVRGQCDVAVVSVADVAGHLGLDA